MEVVCNCMKKLNRSLAAVYLFSFFMRALSQPFHFPLLFPGNNLDGRLTEKSNNCK